MSPLIELLTLLAAYLIGAVPFGYAVARWRGVDILKQGSGNIGATNVGRVLGRRFGILVFLLDFAKGAVPTAAGFWAADRLAGGWTAGLGREGLPVLAGLAAFLGHLFPVYLRFRGGKGVATGAGVVAVLVPGPTAGALAAWLAVVALGRYVSLASLAASLALCGLRLGTTSAPFAPEHRTLTLFCFLAAGLVFARHRANVVRLWHGSESRIRWIPAMPLLVKTVHVLVLGLWFGSSVFFTFAVALSLFRSFESISARPAADRPLWLPLPPEYDRDEASRKEQGSRVAGAAVGPMFTSYFALQAVCAVLAVVTAVVLVGESPERVHKVRVGVLALALVSVAVGWWLERVVSDMRVVRNETGDAVLRSPVPVPENLRTAAATARSDFGRWHFYSLMLNFLTIALVTAGMALAAQLPGPAREPSSSPTSPEKVTQPV